MSATPVQSEPRETAAPSRTRMGGNPTAPTASPDSQSEPAARLRSSAEISQTQAPRAAPRTSNRMPNAILVRLSNIQWKRILPFLGGLIVAAVTLVLLSRWLRSLPEVQSFLLTFPGNPTLPESAPTGLPAWMGWQHFLNMFFLVLIVRTGLQVRHEKKAPASFTPKEGSFFSPKGSTPKKVSLTQWLHQSLDVLWVLNGLIFIVLLFVTSQWMKIVPTNLDVIPNALSAALQYASLDWPHENGWLYYNALQMLAYFTTVFLAAPLAILSGMRFSTWWPDKNGRLSKIYPVEIARKVHYPVMLYFVAFTVVHVFLVFFTGALRNLNHMYTSRDVVDWVGLGVFILSLVVTAAAWILTKPLFTRPLAERFGTLSK
ncbi:cytochrome b/b6 domain-containing protein [Arthrobacter sp. ISL-5]|nr:cytochrome b/b6 domain-containing protein [Arthrobacter sp. ISL-5]